MNTADVVVIGGGINGAATAYNLLRNGVKKVVVVERNQMGSGGTGDSAAIIRQHYSNEALATLAKRSADLLNNFDDLVGGDPGFTRSGWAFLIPQDMVDNFDTNVGMLQRLGIKTDVLTVEQLQQIEPRLSHLDGVVKAAYEPDSGYCEPLTTVHAYMRRIVDLGGALMDHTSVTGLVTDGDRVVGVETDRGPISSDSVVLACGPWSMPLAASVGVDIPLKITREQECIIDVGDSSQLPSIVVSDMAAAIYYRPHRHGRILVGRGFPKPYEEADPFNYSFAGDGPFVDDVLERLKTRLPVAENAICVKAFSGLYDVTPDWNPIMGPVDGVDGFFLCTGFSGHGFKLGPAVGEVMAEQIVNGTTSSIDMGAFNLARFAANELLVGVYGGNRA